MKKRKTPRTGKPPYGFIRVVMDYPADQEPTLTWDIERGHRIGCRNNTALSPYGQLIRIIKRTGDGA